MIFHVVIGYGHPAEFIYWLQEVLWKVLGIFLETVRAQTERACFPSLSSRHAFCSQCSGGGEREGLMKKLTFSGPLEADSCETKGTGWECFHKRLPHFSGIFYVRYFSPLTYWCAGIDCHSLPTQKRSCWITAHSSSTSWWTWFGNILFRSFMPTSRVCSSFPCGCFPWSEHWLHKKTRKWLFPLLFSRGDCV